MINQSKGSWVTGEKEVDQLNNGQIDSHTTSEAVGA